MPDHEKHSPTVLGLPLEESQSQSLTWKGALVSIIAGAVILVLIGLLVRHTEIITGRYVSSGAFSRCWPCGAAPSLPGRRPLLRRYPPAPVPQIGRRRCSFT